EADPELLRRAMHAKRLRRKESHPQPRVIPGPEPPRDKPCGRAVERKQQGHPYCPSVGYCPDDSTMARIRKRMGSKLFGKLQKGKEKVRKRKNPVSKNRRGRASGEFEGDIPPVEAFADSD